jgi:hypothetical protein
MALSWTSCPDWQVHDAWEHWNIKTAQLTQVNKVQIELEESTFWTDRQS